jgi:hypothetical protein
MRENRVGILSAILSGVVFLATGIFLGGLWPVSADWTFSSDLLPIQISSGTDQGVDFSDTGGNLPDAPVSVLAVSAPGRAPWQIISEVESAQFIINLPLVLKQFQVNPPSPTSTPTPTESQQRPAQRRLRPPQRRRPPPHPPLPRRQPLHPHPPPRPRLCCRRCSTPISTRAMWPGRKIQPRFRVI